MALIAIPRARAPRLDPGALKAALGAPKVRAAGAAGLFAVCAITVVMLLAPASSGPVRVHLSSVFAQAPLGWREALNPASMTWVSQDVVRFSETPAGPSTPPSGAASAAAGALPQAPIAGFFAPGPGGPLPIIAQDGRTPFQAYSRPFVSNGRPKIALVIGGLGLDARATQTAIATLPPQITLAFAPYAEGLQGWIDMARAHGHEVLLETPMEPVDYPDNDPGPYTLMAAAPGPETAKKLEWVLSRASGYFALTNYLGSRFLGDERAYQGFVGALRSRRLGVIDDQLSQSAIDRQLLALEAGAIERGQALGAGFAYPVTLEKVARWAQNVEQRGYQLAPASALAVKK